MLTAQIDLTVYRILLGLQITQQVEMLVNNELLYKLATAYANYSARNKMD